MLFIIAARMHVHREGGYGAEVGWVACTDLLSLGLTSTTLLHTYASMVCACEQALQGAHGGLGGLLGFSTGDYPTYVHILYICYLVWSMR